SNVRAAWACRLAAGKVMPGILSFGDEVMEEIISRLPTGEWQDLAVSALARNAAKTLPRILEIVFDPGQQLAYRVPALQVLERAGMLAQDVVEKLIALALDDEESLLVKIGAINVLAVQDSSKYGELKGEMEGIIDINPLKHYVCNGRIPIQVGNFAATDRQNVLVRAVIGFPAEYKIGGSGDFTVEDQFGHPVYFEMKPMSYWDSGSKHVRTAEITFYPNLAAQEQAVFFVNLNAKNAGVVKPGRVDTAGQVRIRIPEAGLEVISTPRLDRGERWMPQLVVAKDGSGNFMSVQDAIDAVPGFNENRVIIYVTEGFYHEKIIIPVDKNRITLIGANRDTTILNFNETPYVQYSSDAQYRISNASTAVLSNDFTAENITFQNSSPQGEGQALAVDLRGDRMVFTNCRFVSHQDTVYCNTQGRLYFYQCHIEGDVDYIYGPATAVFEDCDIVNVRKTGGYVTAASTPEDKEFGLVFINSRIIGDVNPGTVWLGRPWRQFAHVAYINCYMSEVVQRTGWHNWGKPDYEKTARYEEYNSYGPGANPTGRVPWSRQLTDEEASRYTAENILKGDDGWNPKR
ncbi:MAG TPA: pectinesterase family protein, partial [Limnochordia bacterium]|nr:pectinesterase family protein [Limnochordia bacterium]